MHIAGDKPTSRNNRRHATEGRRFAPDTESVADALETVRALDADSYQALLGELGLTPDPRLSVPGCGQRRRIAG